MKASEVERTLREIDLRNTALWVGFLVAFSIVFKDLKAFGGLFFGGLLALLNFRSIKRDGRAVLEAARAGGSPRQAMGGYLFKFYLRLFANGVVIFLLLKLNLVSPIFLLLGLSIVALQIMFWGLEGVIRNRYFN